MKHEVSLQSGSMRQRNILEGLSVFVAVAETLSFTAAAGRLGISPSAASQAVRNLEERIGTLLLRRSTRSISLTDAGADYLSNAGPALAQLHRATQDIAGRSVQPSGSLRLSMPRAAFNRRIAPVLKGFQAAYPDIVVEVDVEGRLIDIVERGFDAGVRYGDLLERDMVAVKISSPSEAVLVASPEYLRSRKTPCRPADLLEHHAVVCRREMTGQIVPWVIRSGNETVRLAPPARCIVQDLVSEIELTVRGFGIGCLPIASVSDLLRSGKLTRVVAAWSVPLEPLYLYFPSQRHKSAALRAFIAFLQAHPEDAGSEVS